MHITQGFPNPLENCHRLDLVLKGIKCTKPRASGQERLPITPSILLHIKAGLEKTVTTFDQKMMWAACTMAFFAFLRCGEFTQESPTSYNKDKHLSMGEIAVDSHENPTVMTIFLRSSKTDQFGQGTTLYVGRGDTQLCPISAMMHYLAAQPTVPGPLFINQGGTPLTKQSFTTHVHQALKATGINTQGYKGHSFRIGATTTAAVNGVSDSLIKTLGRWTSTTYQLYIRTSPTELSKATSILASSPDI